MNEEQKQIVEQFWDDYYIIDIPDKEIFLAFCENLVRMEASRTDIKDDNKIKWFMEGEIEKARKEGIKFTIYLMKKYGIAKTFNDRIKKELEK